MATATLEERYAANLHGVLSCFDRIIITGTLPVACYADGMTRYLQGRLCVLANSTGHFIGAPCTTM